MGFAFRRFGRSTVIVWCAALHVGCDVCWRAHRVGMLGRAERANARTQTGEKKTHAMSSTVVLCWVYVIVVFLCIRVCVYIRFVNKRITKHPS